MEHSCHPSTGDTETKERWSSLATQPSLKPARDHASKYRGWTTSEEGTEAHLWLPHALAHNVQNTHK